MYLQIMYLLYFSCPAMGIRQTQGTFYVPKKPLIVQRLPITLTPAEQQVYNAVMNSNAILQLQVEIQAAADALRYDHDYFNLLVHNYMTYPPLVNYSK